MNASTLILFGHGARDPEWANPLRQVQLAIQASQPQRRVELAFLEYLTPSLEDCVAAIVAGQPDAVGAEIVIVPMFIAQGGHLKRDVPERVAALRERFPGLALRVADVIGEVPSVVTAIAAYAARQ